MNIKVDKPDGEKYYHYEILLKEKPVENSVELWLGNNPQNPKYFSVFSDEKRVVYRHESNIKWLKDYLQGVEPAITISYIPLSR